MRFTGSTWKRSRRLGVSISESGKEFKKRTYGPGQHGADRKKKPSEYGKQLLEKQKLRQLYGVNERQFRRMFMLALRSEEVTGFAFMKILESRLDNMVFRMGFARTRAAARQLVNHGHVLLNGKKVDIPSALTKVGDVISIKESSRSIKIIKDTLENTAHTVGWVEVDEAKFEGKILREPERKELTQEVTESQIVEFYNRKL